MEDVYEDGMLKPLPEWIKHHSTPSSNMQMYRDKVLNALIQEINGIKAGKKKAKEILDAYDRD